MLKKIRQSNLFLFIAIVLVTLGVSLSLQQSFAYVFKGSIDGLEVGLHEAVLIDGLGKNVIYGNASSSQPLGNLMKLQKGLVDKFTIDHNGKTWAAGDVCSEPHGCLSDIASFAEADTLQTVTERHASTNQAIAINNTLTVSGRVGV